MNLLRYDSTSPSENYSTDEDEVHSEQCYKNPTENKTKPKKLRKAKAETYLHMGHLYAYVLKTIHAQTNLAYSVLQTQFFQTFMNIFLEILKFCSCFANMHSSEN